MKRKNDRLADDALPPHSTPVDDTRTRRLVRIQKRSRGGKFKLGECHSCYIDCSSDRIFRLCGVCTYHVCTDCIAKTVRVSTAKDRAIVVPCLACRRLIKLPGDHLNFILENRGSCVEISSMDGKENFILFRCRFSSEHGLAKVISKSNG